MDEWTEICHTISVCFQPLARQPRNSSAGKVLSQHVHIVAIVLEVRVILLWYMYYNAYLSAFYIFSPGINKYLCWKELPVLCYYNDSFSKFSSLVFSYHLRSVIIGLFCVFFWSRRSVASRQILLNFNFSTLRLTNLVTPLLGSEWYFGHFLSC